MLISRNDIIYRAMEVLREPLYRHFDEHLKKCGKAKWFDTLIAKPKMEDERAVIQEFYDKRDVYVLFKAIQFYWTTIEKYKILDTASIGSAYNLEDARNEIAHPTGQMKYEAAVKVFKSIKHLVAQLDDKKAISEIDELAKAHETVSHIAIRSGEFCRHCGRTHKEHNGEECPPVYKVGESKEKIRNYCEICGSRCVLHQELAWFSTCPTCKKE